MWHERVALRFFAGSLAKENAAIELSSIKRPPTEFSMRVKATLADADGNALWGGVRADHPVRRCEPAEGCDVGWVGREQL